MHPIDWVLVIGLNGSIIIYGLYLSRETQSSADWFLGSRNLPWWLIGLSLYATAIDSSDLVADSGGTYGMGMRYFAVNWLGVIFGWMLAAHFVVLPMYRAGMYTNAEYLEARFGPTTRVISALVQVQYRTMVLGIIGTTIYYSLRVVCEFQPATAWTVVVLVALLAALYTALGGLRSVAVTDALQSGVMVVAAMILFGVVWQQLGGWSGINQRLADAEAQLPQRVLRMGSEYVESKDVAKQSDEAIHRELLLGGEFDDAEQTVTRRWPGWLLCLKFLIIGISYAVVNHTQSMRMFGARTEWDLKMSVVVASLLMLPMTFCNMMIGVMGRAMYPDPRQMPLEQALRKADSIYPLMVRGFDVLGFKGIVVAGLLAAAFSTYDSIGSTLSALLTRDVYARLIVPDARDRHYLRVGQLLTVVVILGSFAYVPFLLEQGMVYFFFSLVGTFVVPLLAVYLMGTFTRVHRRGGTIGLLVGVGYGVWRLIAQWTASQHGVMLMPSVMIDEQVSYPVSLLITSSTMLAVSLVCGWEPRGQLLLKNRDGWLASSELAVQQIDQTHRRVHQAAWPVMGALLVTAAALYLVFVLFW